MNIRYSLLWIILEKKVDTIIWSTYTFEKNRWNLHLKFDPNQDSTTWDNADIEFVSVGGGGPQSYFSLTQLRLS